MHNKYRIAILGIGGVGGFIGGKLAAAFSPSADVEVIFIARGAHARAIREDGLKLITSGGDAIVKPDIVTDDASDIGKIDLLICCTKTYDLENSVKAMLPSITPGTLILPLLNGADNSEKLQALLPDAKVLHGCIYLVSKIIAPGTVQQRGDFYSLHFGGNETLKDELLKLKELFERADITSVLEADIHQKVWSKFSFISPVATYTSAYNISLGKILESEEHTTKLKTLMTELVTLARSLNIELPADVIEKNFQVVAKLPYETTSSMQADMVNNRPSELETLTGVVIRKAAGQGIQLDSYTAMYQLLRERQASV